MKTQSSSFRLKDRYRHLNGISAIVKVRGQRNLKTDFGRQLYLGTRVSDVSPLLILIPHTDIYS